MNQLLFILTWFFFLSKFKILLMASHDSPKQDIETEPKAQELFSECV